MSERRKSAAPHAPEPEPESVVYLGRDFAGSIVVETKGRVIATDAAGKRIGIFQTDRAAMTAILRAAREAKR